MAEHRSSSDAVTAGAPEPPHRRSKDSEGDDGRRVDEEGKEEMEEVDERVGESLAVTELQGGELRSSDELPVESNLVTLAAVPSSTVQHQSHGI